MVQRIGNKLSSILVLYILLHAVYFWSTWMMSCLHFDIPFFHYLSFLYSSSSSSHLNTSPKRLTLYFFKCTHDVIQVDQKYTACSKK